MPACTPRDGAGVAGMALEGGPGGDIAGEACLPHAGSGCTVLHSYCCVVVLLTVHAQADLSLTAAGLPVNLGAF